ncbi:MAG: hypothetical protein HYW25_05015 [Candidatus Aenigmarchaeota archaeon]|nr:hypothetical protein [Candidatus Aenigmarchaeota archaeon]
MKLYRFSPIQSKEELMEAVKYVAVQIAELCNKIIGEKLPIGYITIFSHHRDEYEKLIKILHDMGETSAANNGVRVALKSCIPPVFDWW